MNFSKHVKPFEQFIFESLVMGKRNPRWMNFSRKIKLMSPSPEVVSPPEDEDIEVLSWGSTIDPAKKYGVIISSPYPEIPNEQISFWLEDPYLLQTIKKWWDKKGYVMEEGEVPSSGDDPEETPRVYINFDKADQVIRDLTSFFKEIPL